MEEKFDTGNFEKFEYSLAIIIVLLFIATFIGCMTIDTVNYGTEGFEETISEKEVDITVLLDHSGSMSDIEDQVIKSFNDFVNEQKTIDKEAKLTLVKFNHSYSPEYQGVDMKLAKDLDSISYSPNGRTALFDAIGKTVKNTERRVNSLTKDTKVVLVITTDGLENSSTEFELNEIKSLIAHCREELKWEFIFLAAGEDVFEQGREFGIDQNLMMLIEPGNEVEYEKSFLNTSQMLLNMRTGEDKELKGFDDMESNQK